MLQNLLVILLVITAIVLITVILLQPDRSRGIAKTANVLDQEKEGIETRPLWKPLHLQPVFANVPRYERGVSEALFNEGLCLPSGPYVTDNDIKRIVTGVKACIKG